MPRLKQEVTEQSPRGLRPFEFHGVVFDSADRDQAKADCPFCGRKKFAVEVETGKWRCYVCDEGDPGPSGVRGGNATTFLRKLWEYSEKQTRDYAELEADRGLLDPATLIQWGAVKSILTGEWLLPGYTLEKKVGQLYKFSLNRKTGKRLLFATSEVHNYPFGTQLWDAKKPTAYVLEAWNAPALWEVLRAAKRGEHGLVPTANEVGSLLASANVLGIPGCNSFQASWLPLLAGKRVVVMFDNDHERQVTHAAGMPNSRRMDGAGLAATKRLAKMAVGVAESVSWLRWDSELPDGFDVRDALRAHETMAGRVAELQELLAAVEPVPADWLGDPAESKSVSGGKSEILPLECRSWDVLLDAWFGRESGGVRAGGALHGRQDLEDTLAAALAVATSTSQAGDQLFLQVVGDPGSGKSEICDALMVSKSCHLFEHLTGLHSGWKGEEGRDCSLLARINHKTLVTPEMDTIMASPFFPELMSQLRRVFDGKSSHTYKNSDKDTVYEGLRTPWIGAGTPAILDNDQSRVGDRFLKIIIRRPSEEEEQALLEHTSLAALLECVQTSNGDSSTTKEEKKLRAYRLTGGYVDYLRESASELIGKIAAATDTKRVFAQCQNLARFTAAMRARPHPDTKKDEVNDSKELPTRLNKQFTRLALCLAAALGRPAVDDRVMGIVRKVALDTGRGRSLEIVRRLHDPERWGARGTLPEQGLALAALARGVGMTDDRCRNLVTFLRRTGVLQEVRVRSRGSVTYTRIRLTDKMRTLFEEVGCG